MHVSTFFRRLITTNPIQSNPIDQFTQEHADARITDIGKKQCADLKAAKHAVLLEAKLVIVSPLTRAIQTALLSIEQVAWRALFDAFPTSSF